MQASSLRNLSLALVASLAWSVTSVGSPESGADGCSLPGAFATQVVGHARRLAARGPRPASSEGELAALEYVAGELAAAGIVVQRESFTYLEFDFRSLTLTLAGRQVEPVVIGFNPFAGEPSLSGEGVPVTARQEEIPSELAGRIVVTDHPLMQLMLLDQDPGAVICVAEEDLAQFVSQPDRSVSLAGEGAPVTLAGANLVARISPPGVSGLGVLVTAHLDAWQVSPGANDNGTGLGALIELARHLQSHRDAMRGPVTLVAFGAEELGSVGSRAFLERHAEELSQIVAVVNLDTLGGAEGPQMGSPAEVAGVPADGRRSQLPPELAGRAWEGLDGRWRIQHRGLLPFITASCTPPWLAEIVDESATALGLSPRTRSLMSDHRTFTQAGVPAISIQSGKHTIHSPEDTADRLVPENIGRAGALAARIIWTLLERWPAAPPPQGG